MQIKIALASGLKKVNIGTKQEWHLQNFRDTVQYQYFLNDMKTLLKFLMMIPVSQGVNLISCEILHC